MKTIYSSVLSPSTQVMQRKLYLKQVMQDHIKRMNKIQRESTESYNRIEAQVNNLQKNRYELKMSRMTEDQKKCYN